MKDLVIHRGNVVKNDRPSLRSSLATRKMNETGLTNPALTEKVRKSFTHKELAEASRQVRKDAKSFQSEENVRSPMKQALNQLRKETERGEHRPDVGGYSDHNHSWS